MQLANLHERRIFKLRFMAAANLGEWLQAVQIMLLEPATEILLRGHTNVLSPAKTVRLQLQTTEDQGL